MPRAISASRSGMGPQKMKRSWSSHGTIFWSAAVYSAKGEWQASSARPRYSGFWRMKRAAPRTNRSGRFTHCTLVRKSRSRSSPPVTVSGSGEGSTTGGNSRPTFSSQDSGKP